MMSNINSRNEPSDGYSVPKTLGQVIYNHIRDGIINNKFKANQKINDKEIAALFHVSTTPVREAVLRLGAEGFLNLNSHREAIVKPISYQEAREILHLLVLLDSYAVKVALPEITHGDVVDLESIFEDLRTARQENRTADYVGLITSFHRRIWACAPNTFLRSMLLNIQDQYLRYNAARSYAYQKEGVIDTIMTEMEQVLGFIRARDTGAVQGLLMKHWVEYFRPSPLADGMREYLESSN
jgi:DNA-binding GntR family transcriptional regulator